MSIEAYVIFYTLIAATAALMAFEGWRRRFYRGGLPFAGIMIGLAFWSLCHGLTPIAPSARIALLVNQARFIGIAIVAPAWLLFAMAYSGLWWETTRSQRGAFFIPALLISAAALSNNYHHLWWPTVTLPSTQPFIPIRTTQGPFYQIHMLYSYACTFGGISFFFYALLTAPREARLRAQLMMMGSLLPTIGNIAYMMGLKLPLIDDPTPPLLLVSGAVSFTAALRYHLLDAAPLAEREVFASLPDGAIALDNRGLVATANVLGPRLLGLGPGPWKGHPLLELAQNSPIASELHEMLRPPIEAHTRQLAVVENEQQCWLEVRVQPLHAADGTIAATLLIVRDVSERVCMEQERIRHLGEVQLINRIARAANTALRADELSDIIARELIEANACQRVAIGLLDDGGAMRLVADRDHNGHAHALGAYVDGAEFAAALSAEGTRMAHQLGRADVIPGGRPVGSRMRDLGFQDALVMPIYGQEHPRGLLFLCLADEDASAPVASRLAETVGELAGDALGRIRLYEEVQRANQTKTAFLATVSHELRTPLTSIIGYIDILQRGTYGPPPERMLGALGSMSHSSINLLQLINDMLDFSRLDAGQLRVDLHPVQVARAVTSVAAALQPQILERGLALRLELEPDLPLVQGNMARLEQALSNLLTNAVKFTDQGEIVIRAARRVGGVRISVSDTGIGIAPEYHEAIFQEFRRVEQGPGKRHGGAGLGLAISKRLVELMHGTLSLESTPGSGSTFHCDLRELAAQPERPTVMG